MKISYGILVHNETTSLKKLLDQLTIQKQYEYEIVIIYDRDDSSETDKILSQYDVKIFHQALNGDFATQKNYMTEMCSGDYIVNIDADELLPDYLLENIHLIIEQNNDVEMLWIPRINIVSDLTQEWAQKFGFHVNDAGYVNFPDYQGRIYKNDFPRIHWINKVHEKLQGFKSFSSLSCDFETIEHLAIQHSKTLNRQIAQNQKYDKIMKGK